MTEIAQLFESALRNNRSSLLRKAAINTVAKMPAETTLRDLLQSDAREAIRELTLDDLAEALDGKGRARAVEAAPMPTEAQSPEEELYRRILDSLVSEPLTIGQLSKRLSMDTTELRSYLNWMKRMGKVQSNGRARATRYFVP
jgi:predicted transcriptional regulator